MATLNLARRTTILMLLLNLALTGCWGGNLASSPPEGSEAETVLVEPRPEEPLAPAEEEAQAEIREEKAVAQEGAAVEADALPATEAPAPASGASGAAPEAMTYAAAEESAPIDAPALAIEPSRGTDSSMTVAPQIGPLRAGEVDDNAQWDDYLLYRRNYQGPQVHDRDVTERYIVEVVDEAGNPVLGAQVHFSLPGQNQQGQPLYSARTYANGRVLFQPLALTQNSLEQIDQFQVEVEYNGLQEAFSLTRFEAQASSNFTERWTVTLEREQPQRENLALDVLFLVDATGSMADEITKIQSTIFDVAAQIDALPSRPEVRYGLVTYRDRGDSFVTRKYEFTPDVRDFSGNLNTLFADGGGDEPESLNEGLHEAIHGVEWRGGEAVQLIFLIADAAPHLDYPQDYDYAVEMDIAAQRGIKIFPLASSGLTDQGEYIFRQIAQYTQGRFLFLTYEGPTNGGAPGDVTTHHVEDYSVENLDALLVKLVAEELAYQSLDPAQN